MTTKKPSLTKIIKDLRQRIKNQSENYYGIYELNIKLADKLSIFEKILPLNNYVVTYKAECKDGQVREFNEVIKERHSLLVSQKLEDSSKKLVIISIAKID